ncbi:hypothetical protein ACR74R_12375, partial [Mediterraneibacter gnavus]|uniref:hypothetical protein n=1 Tax=Mediterraneibacter gnavus TaxID=33038 RepID=UPI003DA602D8
CQKRTAGKTINTVFPAQNEYPQNKKINFVIFYNDLCIPLNSNHEGHDLRENIKKRLTNERDKSKLNIVRNA